MITGIIYRYISPSGKSYIGQTIDEAVRKQFFYNLNCSYGGKKIDNARNRYKPENFIYEVLHKGDYIDEVIAKKILNELEVYYIRKFNSFEGGYNCTIGGESLSGFKHTEETKMKMKNAHLGVPKSEEQILKLKDTLSKKVVVKTRKFLDSVRKPVEQYDKSGVLINSYNSITEASKITGVNGSNIGECCYGRRKSAGNYIWKFV